MRWAIVLACWLCLTAVGRVQEDKPLPRFTIAADLKTFPQGTPREALNSALQAIDAKKFDYLVAQLSDPAFVDGRVQTFGGRFADQVEDTRVRLDPGTIKLLRKFQKDGKWQVNEGEAGLSLESNKEQMVFFRKMGNRWYLENRSKPGVLLKDM
jgi:hypothetical protein